MMQRIILSEEIVCNFYDKNDGQIRIKEITQFSYGGQARIYKFNHGEKEYLLKAVFSNDRKIFRAIDSIRQKLLKEEDLPASVINRTLPIGQGCCKGNVFEGIGSFKFACLFIFKYLNGKALADTVPPVSTKYISDYLKSNSIDNFEVRKRIATSIAQILALLEKNDIVHGDLQDNWLVDNENNVHLIDIEGSGILKGNGWEWAPLAEGKPGYLRPAEDEKDGKTWIRKTTIHTDRWIGLNLIFNVLTGIKHPFFFLSVCDKEKINRFISQTNLKKKDWTPYCIDNSDFKNLLSDPDLRKFFDQLPIELRNLFFQTFITGYNNPESRATFQDIYKALTTL